MSGAAGAGRGRNVNGDRYPEPIAWVRVDREGHRVRSSKLHMRVPGQAQTLCGRRIPAPGTLVVHQQTSALGLCFACLGRFRARA